MLAAFIVSVVGATAAASSPVSASDPAAAVRRVFEDNCSLCHDGSEGLNLEAAPETLLGVRSATGAPLVVPGDPQGSYLVAKIHGGPDIVGDVMPLGEPPLSAEDQRAVRVWIAGLEPAEEAAVEATAEVSEEERSRPVFGGTHQHGLHTTTTLGKRMFEFRVHHRFARWGRPFVDRTYFGLAGGAVMSLAVSYGIIDGLDIMARWTNERLAHELGLKWVPVRQSAGQPLSFGLYASGEVLVEPRENAANRYTGNVQAMVSRLWFDRWATQLTVGFSALTNHSAAPQLRQADGTLVAARDQRGTLYMGLASTVLLGARRRHGIDLEYMVPIPDGRDDFNVFYYAGGDADPAGTAYGTFSLGWSVKAGLHFFQVLASTTRSIHTNFLAPGGGAGNPFVPIGNFYLGFNLSRKWSL